MRLKQADNRSFYEPQESRNNHSCSRHIYRSYLNNDEIEDSYRRSIEPEESSYLNNFGHHDEHSHYHRSKYTPIHHEPISTFAKRKGNHHRKQESDADDELTYRINALKDCIKEIEKKQEHLLHRIDSRINSKAKYQYEAEDNQTRGISPYRKPDNQIEYAERFDAKNYQSSNYDSQNIRRKYYNPYEMTEEYTPDKPPQNQPSHANKKTADFNHVQIQVEDLDRFPTEPNQRHDTMEDQPQINESYTSRKDYNYQPDRTNQEFEYNHVIDSQEDRQKTYSDAEKEELNLSDVSPEKPEMEFPQAHLNQPKPLDLDDIDKQIRERNQKVLDSRRSRMSFTSRSPDSEDNKTYSTPKNPFLSSNKPIGKYELVNDSFGSPTSKAMKAQKKSEAEMSPDTYESQRMNNNDHIIKLLEKQERKLEKFIPPSRVEPVPITMEQTDLSLPYHTSPDVISFQYQDAGSPPHSTFTRKKLFYSPTQEKERRQDNDPEYICNPDTIAAMRAKDLHCGRGSSPLRTKFKSPQSTKSIASSARKSTSRIEYNVENGLLNIHTPSKANKTGYKKYEDTSSPKSKLIDELKQSNSSLKHFKRTRKVMSEESTDRGKNFGNYTVEVKPAKAAQKTSLHKIREFQGIQKQTPRRSGRTSANQM